MALSSSSPACFSWNPSSIFGTFISQVSDVDICSALMSAAVTRHLSDWWVCVKGRKSEEMNFII